MYKQIQAKIPEPLFQCAGADSIIEQTYETHPVEGDAYQGANRLFYADLINEGAARPFYTGIIDEEHPHGTSGFFCDECLEAYGLVTDERMTLLSVIKERMVEATMSAAGFQ